MLVLYRSLTVSKLLYAFPLLSISFCQWELLEVFHRVALRLCLGLPSYALNIPTLVEAEDYPLQHLAEERAMCRRKRLSRTASAAVLLKRLLAKPHSRMGHLAAKYQSDIGSPSRLYPLLPAHQSRSPLQICASLPDLRRKAHTPVPILRHLVAERLVDFQECLQIFTGRSVRPSSATSRAAFLIPTLGVDYARILNITTSSTMAELAAIRTTLQ